MTGNMNSSSIRDHKVKKGILITPLNDALGDKLELSSWALERMPEYLWLGLILLSYGREEGIKRAMNILLEISKNIDDLLFPRLSSIFNLSQNDQRIVYDIFIENIGKETLAPLTLIYKRKNYSAFNDYFYVSELSFEKRSESIIKAIEVFSSKQSNEATDLKFLTVSLMLIKGKLQFCKGTELSATAFADYAYTDHDNEKMHIYRPIIRSTEGALGSADKGDCEFSRSFWQSVGMITECEPMKIEYPIDSNDYSEFIMDCRKALEYVYHTNKEKFLTEDKLSVLIGFINYSIKIFEEISSLSLGNGILGRHGLRTITESYIMFKYLIAKEHEFPNIWREYKLYGIGKYKLILLKARETDYIDNTSHISIPTIDALVNEFMSEEFVNVDFRYFDNQNIKEKSFEVGEKQLYDLFYDYDSGFSHALWGAIRESTMIFCNNAAHNYHSIPDLYVNQGLPDVRADCMMVVKKFFLFLSKDYDLPPAFLNKYLAQ